MSIYGFCNNKCKHEVYTKDEADDKSVVVSPTEPTTNEKVWIQKGNNLFNKNGIILENTRLDSGTSSVYVAESYFTSNYIEVLPNKEYSLQGINAYHLYDENKSKITQNFYSTDSNDVITTNSNAKYIRMSTCNINKVMISQGSTLKEYEEYIEKAIYTKNNNGVYEEFYNESEVNTKLANYKLKGDFAVISQSVAVGSSTAGTATLDYPAGFSYDNCIPVACGLKIIDSKGYNYDGTYVESSDALNNSYKRRFNLNSSNIVLTVFNPNNDAITVNYKIVLMKI